MISQKPTADYLPEAFRALLFSFPAFFVALANFYGLDGAIASAALTAGAYVLWLRRRWNRYHYWSFDGETLVRGNPENLSIPVSEVEALGFGLPKTSAWPELIRKLDSPNNYKRREEKAQQVILIYLAHNKVIPLGIKHMTNDEIFRIFFLLSCVRKFKPDDKVIERLWDAARSSGTEAEFEAKADTESLSLHRFEIVLNDLLKSPFIHKTDEHSKHKSTQIPFSKINRVVQL